MKPILGLFDFSGRESREGFGLILLWGFIAIFAPAILVGIVFDTSPQAMRDHGGGLLFLAGLAMPLVNIGALVVVIAGAVRRLHDQGDGAVGLLVVLIPLVGWVMLAIVLMTPGDIGENRFGPDPNRAGPSPTELKDVFD